MLEELYFLDLNEITLFNFEKCLNGKIGYTRRNVNIGDESSDFEAWCSIYDQYLSRFGIGSKYSIFLDKLQELTILNCDLAITGNRFLLNKIRVLENEIEEFGKEDKSSLTEQVVLVSKWMGSRVNPRETTADEFYTMIDLIKKDNENGKKDK